MKLYPISLDWGHRTSASRIYWAPTAQPVSILSAEIQLLHPACKHVTPPECSRKGSVPESDVDTDVGGGLTANSLWSRYRDTRGAAVKDRLIAYNRPTLRSRPSSARTSRPFSPGPFPLFLRHRSFHAMSSSRTRCPDSRVLNPTNRAVPGDKSFGSGCETESAAGQSQPNREASQSFFGNAGHLMVCRLSHCVELRSLHLH